MAFGMKKDNGPQPPQQSPNLPTASDYAPRSRRIAEEALRAKQEVLDLETDLRNMTMDRDNLRAAFEAIKHDNSRLEDRLARLTIDFESKEAKLTAERDEYRTKIISIEARFDDVATIMYKILHGRISKPPPLEMNMERLENEMKEFVHEHPNSRSPGELQGQSRSDRID